MFQLRHRLQDVGTSQNFQKAIHSTQLRLSFLLWRQITSFMAYSISFCNGTKEALTSEKFDVADESDSSFLSDGNIAI